MSGDSLWALAFLALVLFAGAAVLYGLYLMKRRDGDSFRLKLFGIFEIETKPRADPEEAEQAPDSRPPD